MKNSPPKADASAESSRRRREAEWAQIEFTVDATGAVRDPRLVDSEGTDTFGEARLAAVRQWRYALRQPQAGDTEDQVVVKFESED